MWITEINGNEEKFEDIFYCFTYFPKFHEDFQVLLNEGVIKHIAFDRYEWTDTETSLAEYFTWIGEEERKIRENNLLNIGLYRQSVLLQWLEKNTEGDGAQA
jgi:hypothetical protein